MMRVVLDTNIIISALFCGGVPWQIYYAAILGKYTLLTSADMLTELGMVLQRPKFAPGLTAIGKTAHVILTEHRQIAELVSVALIPVDVIRDPKDRIVLACAVGGNADHIVSGDKDLLTLRIYQHIPILSSSEFLQNLSEG